MTEAAHHGDRARAVVRIGIVGLGAAGRAFIPAIRAHAGLTLVAIADAVTDLREAAAAEHSVAAYASLDEMLAHAGLDAVCIATPTPLHVEHALQAFAAGKHVLVEKPMAVSSSEAQTMIDAAQRAGVQLLVGHSHSYDPPIERMREIIAAGTLGRVRMVNTWCYTDWMYRPRRLEELDVTQGGGVTFRQGSHQFDIIRLLCGGTVRSVKARSFDWDPGRRSSGAHIVFLDFSNGAGATAVYNGYGHFSTTELCFDIGEWGFPQPDAGRVPRARATDLSPEQELAAKQRRALGAIPAHAPHPPFFGLTLVSCERGDMRQSPAGLYLYSDDGRTEITVPTDASPRDRVMSELYDAIRCTSPARHDGAWGLANLQVCEAAVESSASGREVRLQQPGSGPS